MTEHKHAEILRAIADGKEVEGSPRKDCWYPATYDWNPLTHSTLQWRIKPEKKVLRYRVALMKGYSSSVYFTETYYYEDNNDSWEEDPCFVRWLTDWQEVEVE